MIDRRSLAPMNTIHPILVYRDPKAAIDFLCRAFGFERQLVVDGDDGGVAHAELRLGDGIVMLATASDAMPAGAHRVYVSVDDADAHHARAAAEGAEVTEPPADRDYGSREYGVRDPEGGVWWFGTYVPAPVGG